MSEKTKSDLILNWYDRHRRVLPWRALPGETSDPYRVWLSEIMLQQTTVAAVKSYFVFFTDTWPTVQDLARADLDDVLRAWAGLGYYARARNLHKCARVLAELGGRFPDEETELLALPGIGPYTAAAIASIAFGRRAVVMDGNVERVMARLFAETDPLPRVKKTLKAHAAALTPLKRCGDYAQAVMDLGATLCTPRSPKCGLCPWQSGCRAHEADMVESLPRRTPKAPRPTRYGVVFWVEDQGAVLLRRRPEEGLLGGMMEVPSTPWREQVWDLSDAQSQAPVSAGWRELPGGVRHTFTHFNLELKVLTAEVRDVQGTLVPIDALGEQALPSVMVKVVSHVRGANAQKQRIDRRVSG